MEKGYTPKKIPTSLKKKNLGKTSFLHLYTVNPLNSGPHEQGSSPEKGPDYNYSSLLFLTK